MNLRRLKMAMVTILTWQFTAFQKAQQGIRLFYLSFQALRFILGAVVIRELYEFNRAYIGPNHRKKES